MLEFTVEETEASEILNGELADIGSPFKVYLKFESNGIILTDLTETVYDDSAAYEKLEDILFNDRDDPFDTIAPRIMMMDCLDKELLTRQTTYRGIELGEEFNKVHGIITTMSAQAEVPYIEMIDVVLDDIDNNGFDMDRIESLPFQLDDEILIS